MDLHEAIRYSSISERSAIRFPGSNLDPYVEEKRMGYVAGAEEQKSIDDEDRSDALFLQHQMLVQKACDLMCKECKILKKMLISCTCITDKSECSVRQNFIKSMME